MSDKERVINALMALYPGYSVEKIERPIIIAGGRFGANYHEFLHPINCVRFKDCSIDKIFRDPVSGNDYRYGIMDMFKIIYIE